MRKITAKKIRNIARQGFRQTPGHTFKNFYRFCKRAYNRGALKI